MKFLTIDEIKKVFAKLLIKHRKYTKYEAEIAVSDFPDPYTNCYLNESFLEDNVEICGELYQKYATSTSLWRVGIHDVPDLYFYTYYKAEDIKGHTVGDYMNAHKLYQIDELNDEDFPNKVRA